MITFGDILEEGFWDEWCEAKGLNPWCLNECRASSDDDAGPIIREYIEMHKALKRITSQSAEPISAAIAEKVLRSIE